ncbi:MAG TPA: hypothetical protein VHI13_15730 [Candidatus Kapabacteria bacterium]|nr:hypothetical protein [Candidatus Kapabacteria bacterium]
MRRLGPVTLILLFTLAYAPRLLAQPASALPPAVADTLEDRPVRNQIYFGAGLNASLFSGAGLSGRLMLPEGMAAQLTFFVITAGQWTHFNVGAEGQYAFIRRPSSRFYGLLGFGFYTSTTSDTSYPGNRIANPVRIGLGAGYEWNVADQLVLDIGGAITYFPNTTEFIPTPRMAIFFYFK